MEHIRHRVGIDAPIERVYEAVATPEGLAGWWTPDVAGEPAEGGRLAFGFGGPEPAAVFAIEELTPPTRVRWRCVAGMAEWLGSTVTYDLHEADGETVVLFTHSWLEASEVLHHCSTKWATFLLGMRAGLEGGTPTPWPADVSLGAWR
jgi:uncharacterized protein YndB with AHSA1/START domain